MSLTWGIVPDGTAIGGAPVSGEDATDPSSLISGLNAQFGAPTTPGDLSTASWFSSFESSFDRWAELSGVSFSHEDADDGAAMGAGGAAGSAGVRADLRIGGRALDGSGGGVLGYNYFPQNGDMVLDTENIADVFSNNQAFRNLIMHEAGHGLGFRHLDSNDSNHLMEPFLNTSFDGPQLDDILAVQRSYGDALEKSGGNDSSGTATNLGALMTTLSNGTLGDNTVVGGSQTDFISIDGTSDVDYFSFSTSQSGTLDVILTPRGATYNEGPEGGPEAALDTKTLSDLMFDVLDMDGTSILDSAFGNGPGVIESVSGLNLGSAGTYFVRVTPEGGAADNVQLYGLDLSFTASASGSFWDSNGAAAGSDNTGGAWSDAKWTSDPAGLIGTGTFDNNTTATFSAGSNGTGTFSVASDVNADIAGINFEEGTVTLTDGGGTLTLTAPGIDVAPSLTATIAAPLAGVVGLEKNGDGTLVLEGMHGYTGATDVSSGTLVVNGDLVSTSSLSVASGATLAGSGSVAGAMTIEGTHSPGTSPGLFEAGDDLSYSTGANVIWELVDNTTTGRGSDFDGINVAGELAFGSSVDLELVFDFAGSAVDWQDAFWQGDYVGTAGWLVYEEATDLIGFNNLSITPENWLDGSGQSFGSFLAGSSFSLHQDTNDVYLNYNYNVVIPEPQTTLLFSLGLFGILMRRRRALIS